MTSLYEKLECIGKGSFGHVYKGRELATGNVVALKLVDLERADEEIDVIQREIKVMSQISNPFVVRYHTSLMQGSTLWIVMEFMAGGSLKDLIDAVGPLPEDAIATIMKALCKGLDYVHKGRKLHRDIKAANILLSAHGDVKLADFGVAGQMTTTVRQRNTFVGSPFWMAPEVIQESLYDEKADIWSVGITAIELANGLPPYATQHPYSALFLIPKNDPPRLEGAQFSRSFKEFVSLCLRKNPVERSSAEQLLSHAFVKKARSGAVREVLRQKEASAAVVEEDNADRVVIGGDSYTGSRPASSPNGSLGSAQARGADTLAKWEFDFGSLNDDDKPPAAASAAAAAAADPTDANGQPSSATVATSGGVTENASELATAPAADTLPLPSAPQPPDEQSRGNGHDSPVFAQSPPPVTTAASAPELGTGKRSDARAGSGAAEGEGELGGAMRLSRSQEETRASGGGGGGGRVDAATSEVLTEVILPVVSQIRGDVDAAGGDEAALIRSLGLLEVAFVDVETTKPGFSATLLRALFQEALRSKSPGVRAVLSTSVLPESQHGPG